MSAEAVHYNVHDAKTHLSRIIERVERGEEVIIDRAGVPVAKVVPLVRRVNRTAVGSSPVRWICRATGTRHRPTPRSLPTSGWANDPVAGHDTHIALWAITGDAALGEDVLNRLRHDPDVFLSPVSLWEITLKQAIGTLAGPTDLAERVRDMGFRELPVTHARVIAAGRLAPHRRDPFDRMLVAQAATEGLTLVSRDESIALYDVDILNV
jgi:prevent-host-death family protein